MSFLNNVRRLDTGERLAGWLKPLATVTLNTDANVVHEPFNISHRYRWQATLEVDLAISNPNAPGALLQAEQHAHRFFLRQVYGPQISYVQDAMSALEYGDQDSVRQILNTLLRSME